MMHEFISGIIEIKANQANDGVVEEFIGKEDTIYTFSKTDLINNETFKDVNPYRST